MGVCDAGLLARPELVADIMERLEAGGAGVLVAPAGGGKSVTARLVQEAWLGPVVWLRVRQAHRDAVALVEALIEALSRALPDCVDDLLVRMLAAGEILPDDPETPVARFCAGMRLVYPRRALLVVDDLHLLADSPGAHLLARLLAALPPGWHWLLCSRPPLPAALQQVSLAVPRFGDDRLRFSLDETHRLLERAGSRQPLPDQVRRVMAETGGLPLGVALAATGARPGEAMVEAIGRRLPAPVWRLLLKLALLPMSDLELLRGVLGDRATERLLGMVGVLPGLQAQDGRLLLHDALRPALAEAARRTLTGEECRGLLDSGARALLRAGRVVDSARLRCEMQDWAGLEALVARYGMRLLGQGRHASCAALLEQVPPEVVEASPALLLMRGSLLSTRGSREAGRVLEAATLRARANGEPVLELLALTRRLEYEGGIAGGYEHLEVLTQEAEALAAGVLDELTPPARAWYHAIIGAAWELGRCDFDTASVHFEEASRLAAEHDLICTQMLVAYLRYHQQAARSRFDAAWHFLDDMHAMASSGRVSGMYEGLLHLATISQLLNTGRNREVVRMSDALLARGGVREGHAALAEGFLLRWKAEALIALNDARAAGDTLQRALAMPGLRLAPFLESQIHQVAAVAHALGGDEAPARRAIEVSARLRRPFAERHHLVYHHLSLAMSWLLLGDGRSAAARLAEGERVARETQKFHALAHLVLLGALQTARQGDAEGARARFAEADGLIRRHALDWLPGWVPRLMQEALARGIEVDAEAGLLDWLAERLGMSWSPGNGAVPLLQIRCLGGLALEQDGAMLESADLTPAQRELLALLLMQPRHELAHETLQAQLQPERDAERARAAVDTLVSRLRGVLDRRFGKGTARRHLQVRNGVIALRRVGSDLARFRRGARDIEQALEEGLVWKAACLGRSVLESYHGPFFDGLAGGESVQRFRDALEREHAVLVRRLEETGKVEWARVA